ncbi:MAG: SDR family oxidoreductase [Betaproteobacteria bacterium]|nr:SDR family oxidoreductase [Betaproteobacteria bacterium]
MVRIGDSLKGQRVLITQSKAFMGPALCECFENHGARVIADNTNPQDAPAFAAMAEAVVAQGPIDAVIANLALPSPQTRCHQVSDEEWLVMGSATALRGQRNVSSYAAARGAQLAWVRAVGVEMAMHQVHVNLIAQNFVENPTYYPPEVQALEAFQERLKREVPLGRLATPQEDALFAVFLVSREVNFFAGQAFPFAGGWV